MKIHKPYIIVFSSVEYCKIQATANYSYGKNIVQQIRAAELWNIVWRDILTSHSQFMDSIGRIFKQWRKTSESSQKNLQKEKQKKKKDLRNLNGIIKNQSPQE